jgi:ribosome maturation factor RimP
MESTSERVAQVVEPAIEAEGYALIDIELKGGDGGWILRLFIDKPADEGGITLDDCQKISVLVNPLLDVEDTIEGRYFLEVSSPGVNRRIRKRKDFEKFAGSKVKIRTRSPMSGRRNFTGIIECVEGEDVLLRDEASGSEQISRIPLSVIEKANLQIT